MSNSMLEYSKTILQKVSFDRALFEKELKKAVKMLVGYDRQELQRWVVNNFGYQYQMYFAEISPR